MSHQTIELIFQDFIWQLVTVCHSKYGIMTLCRLIKTSPHPLNSRFPREIRTHQIKIIYCFKTTHLNVLLTILDGSMNGCRFTQLAISVIQYTYKEEYMQHAV